MRLGKDSIVDVLEASTKAKIPVIDLTTSFPSLGAVALSSNTRDPFYGDGTTWLPFGGPGSPVSIVKTAQALPAPAATAGVIFTSATLYTQVLTAGLPVPANQLSTYRFRMLFSVDGTWALLPRAALFVFPPGTMLSPPATPLVIQGVGSGANNPLPFESLATGVEMATDPDGSFTVTVGPFTPTDATRPFDYVASVLFTF
jgi:hypothetical protein